LAETFSRISSGLTFSIEVYEGDRFTYGETLDIAVAFSRALAQKFQVQRGRAKGEPCSYLANMFWLHFAGPFWKLEENSGSNCNVHFHCNVHFQN